MMILIAVLCLWLCRLAHFDGLVPASSRHTEPRPSAITKVEHDAIATRLPEIIELPDELGEPHLAQRDRDVVLLVGAPL
eukprot:4221011-Prymnesium_polylepis.1